MCPTEFHIHFWQVQTQEIPLFLQCVLFLDLLPLCMLPFCNQVAAFLPEVHSFYFDFPHELLTNAMISCYLCLGKALLETNDLSNVFKLFLNSFDPIFPGFLIVLRLFRCIIGSAVHLWLWVIFESKSLLPLFLLFEAVPFVSLEDWHHSGIFQPLHCLLSFQM